MNNFTKEIYKILGMDCNIKFIDQIENKYNKSVFIKIDKLLESMEYEIISKNLPLEDAIGFLDYICSFFEKRDDFLGATVKKRFKGKEGIKAYIDNDIKKIEDFKEYINKVGNIKRYEGKVISASFGFGCTGYANRKLMLMAQFLDEMIEDLNREDQDYKIFTEYKLYKKNTIAKTIIDKLKTYNKFTKRELENFSTKLNSINK